MAVSLIRVGGSSIPLKYIYKESFKVTPNRVQDLEPKRDEEGYLHRNALDHTVTTIQFQTKPMWNSDLSRLMGIITSGFSNSLERKAYVSYVNPLTGGSGSGQFYMPDVEFTINRVDERTGRVLYNSATIEFIEY